MTANCPDSWKKTKGTDVVTGVSIVAGMFLPMTLLAWAGVPLAYLQFRCCQGTAWNRWSAIFQALSVAGVQTCALTFVWGSNRHSFPPFLLLITAMSALAGAASIGRFYALRRA